MPIVAPGLKIPNIGWNGLIRGEDCPLSAGIIEGDMVYYVHSYKVVTPMKYISLYSEYGGIIPGWFSKEMYSEHSSIRKKAENSGSRC